MEAIKTQKINGVIYHTLAKRPLEDGEQIHVKWTDGSETLETLRVEKHTPVGGEHRHFGMIVIPHKGGNLVMSATNLLAERKSYRDQVLKTQAKFDAAVETVVKKVIAEAKTLKKSKRKSKKTRRRARK